MRNKDNLHFTWMVPMSYNKIWNICICEREAGKSVSSWLHIWSAYHYQNRPSIVLRRRIADITSAYLDDTAEVLNKFLDEPIQLLYMKGDVKSGIIDVKMAPAGEELSYNQIKKLPTFFRVIALSNPMNRIKSLVLKDVKYFLYDEFICNLRGGEKYLTADEMFLIQEIYTTYNREASTPIRILCAGNPYSVYNPIFTGLGVDTSKLKPGAFIVGDNYVIDCFKTPDALKEKILAANPMYEFDDSYRRYAFNGEAVNDANIRLQKCEPKGFKMLYVFRMGRDFISLHKGSGHNQQGEFTYWCCKHKPDWLAKISKKRKIIVFDWADMMDNSIKVNPWEIQSLKGLKQAMNTRLITYNCIDAQYMLEDIYTYL